MSNLTLIVEKNSSGHRLYYVRLLAAAAAERGDCVRIALSAGQIRSNEIEIHLANLPKNVAIVFYHDFDLASVSRVSRELNASTVVVPDGDSFAMDLARFGRWTGSGQLSVLIMREIGQPTRVPGAQYLKTKLRLHLFRKAARLSNVKICVLKPANWAALSEFHPAVDPITFAASDEDVEGVRRNWGLVGDRYWFAVLGAISARKNVDVLANALRQTAPNRLGLLVAGHCDKATLERMKEPLAKLSVAGAKTVVVNRLLTDLELDAAVRGADCLVLAHSNEGPSGMLGKAAAAGTRVVAAGALSLRDDIDLLPHMAAWVPLEITALASALNVALDLPRPSPVLQVSAIGFTEALL